MLITGKTNWLTKTWVAALLAFVCSALWGSAFSGVKTGYKIMGTDPSDWASQLVFAGIRFFIAGLMVIAAGSFFSKKPLVPSRKAVPKVVILSSFQTILQYFFYYIGLAHTTGVKAAVIVASNVFLAILISALIFKTEKLTFAKITGCIIGFSGITLINLNGLNSFFDLNFIGDGFVFLCTAASGFSSAFMKRFSASENPVMLSGWQFCFGGAVLWLVGFIGGGSFGRMTFSSVMILIYLAFVSAAAYSLWSVLLKYNPVSKIAVFGFMNPVCGVIISGIVLHESGMFGVRGIISLLLVCIGIFTVNRIGISDK